MAILTRKFTPLPFLAHRALDDLAKANGDAISSSLRTSAPDHGDLPPPNRASSKAPTRDVGQQSESSRGSHGSKARTGDGTPLTVDLCSRSLARRPMCAYP